MNNLVRSCSITWTVALVGFIVCLLVSNQTLLFGQWKFAYISLGRPDYFEDSDTVAVKFQVQSGFLSVRWSIYCLYLYVASILTLYLFDIFNLIKRNMYGAWEQYLGLEHPDTAPRKAHTINQVDLTHCFHCFAFLLISQILFCDRCLLCVQCAEPAFIWETCKNL